MEAQLKAMRVPELKELATKAGINVAAKLTKDKIVALLLESPNVASLLDGTSAASAPAAPSSKPNEAPAASAAPTVVKSAPAKGSIADLLAPAPELDRPAAAPAPTVGAPLASAAEPAHVSKVVGVVDPTPAASNAYGSTATSAAATSAPAATEPAPTREAVPAPIPEVPVNPLEGPSKPVAGTTQLTEEDKRAARKARFEREWQLDQTRKDAEAATKAARDDARAQEVAAKKIAEAAKQAASAPVAAKDHSATKTNGANGHGLPADLVEKRKARFAQGGVQAPPAAPAPTPAPAAAPLLTGADVEKASVRKNKFNSLLPGQPGYQTETREVEASPKRKREEDSDTPAAKKVKSDDVNA